MIQITRVYSDENDESHFEDFEVPLKNNGDIGFLSEDEPVKSIVYIVLEKANSRVVNSRISHIKFRNPSLKKPVYIFTYVL